MGNDGGGGNSNDSPNIWLLSAWATPLLFASSNRMAVDNFGVWRPDEETDVIAVPPVDAVSGRIDLCWSVIWTVDSNSTFPFSKIFWFSVLEILKLSVLGVYKIINSMYFKIQKHRLT